LDIVGCASTVVFAAACYAGGAIAGVGVWGGCVGYPGGSCGVIGTFPALEHSVEEEGGLGRDEGFGEGAGAAEEYLRGERI